jgi:hypothetical protein
VFSENSRIAQASLIGVSATTLEGDASDPEVRGMVYNDGGIDTADMSSGRSGDLVSQVVVSGGGSDDLIFIAGDSGTDYAWKREQDDDRIELVWHHPDDEN